MIPSQTASLKLLAAAGLLLVADPARELRVLRVVPLEAASPTAAVTITFDRPVAGSLDRTVNPTEIFRIEPDLPWGGGLAGSGDSQIPAGGSPAGGGATVRWTVDGVPHAPGRWSLQPGHHRLRAISASGDPAEVTVHVE